MNAETFRAQTLGALLAEVVTERGEEPALIYDDSAISFSTLAGNVRRVCAGLYELGVRRGDTVAVWLPNVPAWVELEFALARLGAVAVAINTKYRRHEAEDIFERSRARVLITQPWHKGTDYLGLIEQFHARRLENLDALILVTDEALPGRVKDRPAVAYRSLLTHGEYPSDDGEPDLPCNAFTSSGTTSAPKLVLHRQAAIAHHARAVADTFSYRHTPAAVVLGMLPFCGVFGFNTIMGALAAGRPAVLLPTYDATEAVAQIERHKVTHTSGSDEMFRRIFDAARPPSRIASLNEGAFANFSTDAEALVEQGVHHGIKLFQTYGSSEVQALMSYAAPGSGPQRWALGGGIPSSPEIRVRVRDPASAELVTHGEHGELEIAGPNVMIGYLNNREATRKTLSADGFVRTGDLGYTEGPDSFVYLARLGDALRLGGFLVNPREIEAYLEGFREIALAQVVAVDTERGPRPVAFVILEPGAAFEEAVIIRRCLSDMAKFKVPVRIVALERFPTTSSANGDKIQKAKLRGMAQQLVSSGTTP